MASAALATNDAPPPSAAEVLGEVGEVVDRDLVPIVGEIDRAGRYPESVMRRLGGAGAYARHLPGLSPDGPDLATAIRAISAAGEHCLSTAFCMWCQDALAWYVWASDNASLKARLGGRVARGEVLGGTGLSNPKKTFFGIETMRLKGRRVDGGWSVKGALPWVSNLGPDHWFGSVFAREDGRPVMALVSCAGPGVKLVDGGEFVALDGTRTFGVQLRDAFIPDADVLADPAESYVKRIRSGFVLMQVGMGLGLARGCIRLIRDVEGQLGHVNRYLDVQAPELEGRLAPREGAPGGAPRSRPRRSGSPTIRSIRTRRSGGAWSRRGSPRASSRSRPPTTPCSIAEPGATSAPARRSAGCARPISWRSSRPR